MIDAFLLGDVDREGPVVVELLELRDQAAVFDVALADADLEGLFVGVAELQVIDVLHHLVDAAALIGAEDVGAGIERQAQALHVVAQHHHRVGVFREAADLALQADPHAVQRGDIDQPPQMLDLFVERRAQLGRRDGDRDDLRRLGQPADRGELLVVGVPFPAVIRTSNATTSSRCVLRQMATAASTSAATCEGLNWSASSNSASSTLVYSKSASRSSAAASDKSRKHSVEAATNTGTLLCSQRTLSRVWRQAGADTLRDRRAGQRLL